MNKEIIRDYLVISIFSETIPVYEMTWDDILEKYEELEEKEPKLKSMTDEIYNHLYDYLDDVLIEIIHNFLNNKPSELNIRNNETLTKLIEDTKELLLILINEKFLKNINEIKKFKDF